MADQKVKFREHLEKFARDHYGEKIGNLNDQQRSDALTLCYLLDIRNALLPGAVPDEFDELQSFIPDGKYDRTVDFLYRDDNNHVTIIQSKHRSPTKIEQESEFDSFRDCLGKLCPQTRPPNQRINQQVLDLITEIEWETDTFDLIYLSLARTSDTISNAAARDLADITGTPLKDISSRAAITYLSEDELNMQWRDVVSQQTGMMPTVDILLSPTGPQREDNLFVFEGAPDLKSYIGLLSAQQVHQLYNRHRDKLFNLNIRNYIGDTRTNKEIINTAVTETDRFFFYNNGISAVARRIDVKQRITNNPQLHRFLDHQRCADLSLHI